MLTAGELHLMRETTGLVLPGTAVIKTMARVSDGMGGSTTTWTATGTVDARMDYLARTGDTEDVEGARVAEVMDYVCTVPYNTAVPATARIEYDGTEYEVQTAPVADPWRLCQRAYCTKVD